MITFNNDDDDNNNHNNNQQQPQQQQQQPTTTTTTILSKGHPVSSRQGDPLGECFFPPILGGNSSSKGSPVLPIPSYPALCREDTTSWNDGRPRTHYDPAGALGDLGS